MVILGAAQFGLGVYVSTSFQGEAYNIAARQFFPFTSPGRATDVGALILCAGVVIGLLAIIAQNTDIRKVKLD